MDVEKGIRNQDNFFSFPNRLKFRNLPQPLRVYTILVTFVALAACFIILLSGSGLYQLETDTALSANTTFPIPFSLILVFLIGLGIVSGSLLYGSYQPGWRWRMPTRIVVGFLGLVCSLNLLKSSENILFLSSGQTQIHVLAYLRFAFVLLAIGSSLAVVICAFFSSTLIRQWAVRLIAGVYIWIVLTFILDKILWGFMTRLALPNTDLQTNLFEPVNKIYLFSIPLIWLTGAVFFWQAITEVKIFSREISVRIANISTKIPGLLPILFLIKVIWLIAGFWALSKGEAKAPWQGSVQDGLIAWLLAAVFGLATGWFLTRQHKPIGPIQFQKSAGFLTIGFLGSFLLTFILFLLTQLFVNLEHAEFVFRDLPLDQCFISSTGSVGTLLGCVSGGLAGVGEAWQKLFVAMLLPLAFIFKRSAKYQYLALVLFLAGLWTVPALLGALVPSINSSFEYLTYDVILTGVLLVIAVLNWRGKIRPISTWNIALVLVISTLVALADSLIPASLVNFGFAVLLVVPMVYQILFDSGDLNVSGARQGAEVLWTIGFQAGLMLVIAWALVLQLVGPEQSTFEQVANKLFLPPILALFLIPLLSTNDKKLPEPPETLGRIKETP